MSAFHPFHHSDSAPGPPSPDIGVDGLALRPYSGSLGMRNVLDSRVELCKNQIQKFTS